MKYIKELLDECKYMPIDFRDFHDQKDLFKLIFSKIEIPQEISNINWVQAHIYTVDIFLWFMAKRGYTLQKARHNIDFIDIHEEIETMKKYKQEQFSSLLTNVNKTNKN